MTNALHLHFNEWPFVDSSGTAKVIANNGIIVQSSETEELLYINASGTNVYGGYYTGQSFTPSGGDWYVTSIYIDSVRTLTAGPFDVTCSLFLDNGGAPSGAALGVSDAVSVNNVLATKTFTFSSPVQLTLGNKYWAVIDCGASDVVWFVRTDSNAYGGGEVGYGNDIPSFAGDSSYECKQFKVTGFTSAVSGSGVFDGASDLQIDRSNSLVPVNSNGWEVDLLVTHVSPSGETYYAQYKDANNYSSLSHIAGTGISFVYVYGGETLISLSGNEITDTEEYHIALTKNGDTFRLYLNGVIQDTATYSLSNELIDSDIFIGQDGNSGNYLNASVRNYRISRIARFISDAFGVYRGYNLETDDDTDLLITFLNSVEDESQSGLSLWNPIQSIRGNVDIGTRIYRFGNQCGYFSGAQDGFDPWALQLPDHPNWYIADQDFTLEAWIHPLSLFNYSGIVTHFETGVDRWQLFLDSAGKLNFYIESESFTLQSSGTVSTDEWSHVAVTRSLELTGAGSSQVWRMYIKGIIQDEAIENHTIPNLTTPFWVGRGTSSANLYHGYMDELRLWIGKALWTSDEFWPSDYLYFDDTTAKYYKRLYRRRIASIQGR